MKTKLIILLGMVLGAYFLPAQNRPVSPYFFLPCKSCALEEFPLLHTDVEVAIAGVIADVQATQYYLNRGEKPVEAIYVFPGSTNSAVYDLQMTIGKRVIQAVIQKKEDARKAYEQAKEQGRTASLLEQHRPNVFQMNVANILPGDSVKVVLRYTELLVMEEGTYSFIYPEVVGPRYAGEPDPEQVVADRWVENPYLKEKEGVPYTIDIRTVLQTGVPIRQVQSPSHEIHVDLEGKSTARIGLKDTERRKGNKDFILNYQLRGEKIETGILLFEGQEENHFLLMAQPPARPDEKAIPPREYIFVLDVSGSMNGFPLDISKVLMEKLLWQLRPVDRFNILLFAGGAVRLHPESVPATPENIRMAMNVFSSQKGGGGTEMLAAIKLAMAVPKPEGFSRSFLLATDGYVNIEPEIFDYMAHHLGDANFFAFGIGTSVNRHLIEGIAHVGSSEPFVITSGEEAPATAERFRRYVETPVLTGIHIDLEGWDAYDLSPEAIPDLMAERPVVLVGKYRGKPGEKITVRGCNADGLYQTTLPVKRQEISTGTQALPFLWARHRIRLLGDYVNLALPDFESKVEKITALGLKYSLLTAYTSFVAIDTLIRNREGTIHSVRQPLPLPEGVPNSAVGNPARIVSTGWGATEIGDQPGYAVSPFPTQPAPPPMPPPPPAEPKVEEVFKMIEEMPRFPGCEEMEGPPGDRRICADQKMLQFLMNNLRYPETLKDAAIGGITLVQFTIEKDGSITDIEILRSLHPLLDREVIRVIRSMPRWIAGKQRGRSVAVRMILPVRVERGRDQLLRIGLADSCAK